MERQLVVLEGKEKGKVFALPETGTFTLGRGNTTDTKLTDLRVSRVHCQIELAVGRVRVVDAKSATGTYVNNQRVPGEYVLHAGDVVKIGDTEMRYDSDDDVAEAATVAGVQLSEAITVGNEALASARASAVASGRADPLQALVGATIGHYTLTKLIAPGRSSLVYRAQDNQQDRAVALKVLNEGVSKNQGEMQSLTHSLQGVLSLHHPNLVALYDLGRDNGRCWFATEYVNGETLGGVMDRAGVAGMVDWQHVLRWALHIARGLEHLHQHGFIHGSITPHAVLVGTSDKVAKLGRMADARPLEEARSKARARPLETLGQVAYRAPEQVRGDLYGDVRTDVYCLGATLYALLTGRPPFEGATPVDALAKVLQPDAMPPRPREFQLVLPEAFEQIVLRMLAKRPDERYATMAEVIADLEAIVAGRSAAATQTPQGGATTREGTIAITCGGCGQKLRPWKKFVGTQVRCPSCAKLLVVPEEPGVVQPADGPASASARTLMPPPPVPEPQAFSNTVILGVGAAIIVLGLGLATFLTLGQGNPAPSTATTPETKTTAR